MDDNTVDPHPRDSMETGAVTLQLLGGLNGGHSPHVEESPSQMHVNLPCIHHKWPLFTPHELIITPEVCEKLGQQHYDLLATFGCYI